MIRPDEQDRRLRDAFATLADRARPADDCPLAERIWSAVQGGLDPEETERLGRHAIECAACGETWRLALDVLREAEGAAEAWPEPARTRARPAWWGLAAAVLLIGAALVVLDVRIPWQGRGEPGYRAPMEDAIRPALEAGANLPRDAFVLRWTGPEDAAWSIEVATEDLTVLNTTTGLAEAEFTVPAEDLAGIPAGGKVIWQVTARLPDGAVVRSASFVNRVE